MINVSTLDAAIALGGYGAGLVVGCLDNVRKTGSLFSYPHDAPKDVSFVVRHLEVNRDKAGLRNILNPSEFVQPKIWNPFVPLEHLAPLTLIIITQVVIAILSPEAAVLATGTLLATHTFKIIVLPIALNATVLFGGLFIRDHLNVYAHQMGVDPSGHAFSQSASAVYKLFVLSALSSLNLSSNPYRVIAAVTTLSDYLWTYRTASSYHSVMDMVFTTLFMGVSFGAVYAGHRAFAAYAPGVFRLLIDKIPLK